jgi:endo-1,4-beta-xylanase
MKKKPFTLFSKIALASLLMPTGACVAAAITPKPTLRQVYKNIFLIGAAVNRAEVSGRSPEAARLVAENFTSITSENDIKWDLIEPQPGVFDFTGADRFVEFGQKNGLAVIGHTLIWHSQTPDWVFKGPDGKPASRELLLQRMETHIKTVVGRYRGKVKGWDVVNEVVSNGDSYLRPSPWLSIIGEDFIVKAFQLAHAADPGAELYYNDYALEKTTKRENAIKLLRKLKAQGVPITGVGVQGHYNLVWPNVADIDKCITDFSRLGLKVMFTELDVDVLPSAWSDHSADISKNYAADPILNPYADGLPVDMQTKLADRYAAIFAVFLKHQQDISRVTLWGVGDGRSWLNNWPVRGRTNYPLLFDRSFQPKPALDAVLSAPMVRK